MTFFKKTISILALIMMSFGSIHQTPPHAQDATAEMRAGVDAFVNKYDRQLSQYQKDRIIKILEEATPNTTGAKKAVLTYLLKQMRSITVLKESSSSTQEIGKTGIKKQSYEKMIKTYCEKPEVTPISIKDPREMTASQVIDYAKQLAKDKDIQRLSLLNTRLNFAAKDKKETKHVKDMIGFSQDDSYKYIFTPREALKKASQANFAEIYFWYTAPELVDALNAGKIETTYMNNALFALSVKMGEKDPEVDINQVRWCLINEYNDSLAMILTSGFYEEEGDTLMAFFWYKAAQDADAVVARDINYKTRGIQDMVNQLQKKYLSFKTVGIDISSQVNTLLEKDRNKRYPQLTTFLYGWPLYLK